MIVGIDHVQLAMPSGLEDKAREFYSGVLGIPEVPKPAELARRGGAWFESGTVKIHLKASLLSCISLQFLPSKWFSWYWEAL